MKILISLLLLLNAAVLPAADLPTIAVADFTCSQQTGLTRGLPDLLSEKLVNSKRFDVYEREKLNTIMREQGLQASGVVDSQSTVALGKLTGVHYLLTGNIINYGKSIRDFRGYGIATRSTIYQLKAGIKVLDVKTGKLLFSKTDVAEEKVSESQATQVTSSTMDTRLAELLATRLIQSLLEDDSFKPAGQPSDITVAVKVTSVPESADVEVDGIFCGNAGGEVRISSGLHTITVSLPGYEVWSKKVQVKDGLSFNVTLAKKAVETKK